MLEIIWINRQHGSSFPRHKTAQSQGSHLEAMGMAPALNLLLL
jgi:hypothetical protein